MKKSLKRVKNKIYYYVDGVLVEGHPSDVSGDLSDVSGDLSGVSGDLSGVVGDLSGVVGDLSGVSGDLNFCDISEHDRVAGIDVSDLVAGD